MNKFTAYFTIFFVVLVLGFSTWQLYSGNLEAAFSALPFLVITYFFVRPGKKHPPEQSLEKPLG
jgi:hypothetical protein